MSVWTRLREPEQDELTTNLVDVCALCTFSEPVQEILNLAEFMSHSEMASFFLLFVCVCKNCLR